MIRATHSTRWVVPTKWTWAFLRLRIVRGGMECGALIPEPMLARLSSERARRNAIAHQWRRVRREAYQLARIKARMVP